MAKFRVLVSETQYYEMYVEANSQEEAEEIAEDTYGCDGEIYSTLVQVNFVEEAN